MFKDVSRTDRFGRRFFEDCLGFGGWILELPPTAAWDLHIGTFLGIWDLEPGVSRGIAMHTPGITREELQRNAAPLTFEFPREP